MATREQLATAMKALEGGKLPFQVVQDEKWQIPPMELRQALIAEYGEKTVKPLLKQARAAGRPQPKPGMDRPAAPQMLARVLQNVAGHPDLTPEQIDEMVTTLKRAIVDLEAKRERKSE